MEATRAELERAVTLGIMWAAQNTALAASPKMVAHVAARVAERILSERTPAPPSPPALELCSKCRAKAEEAKREERVKEAALQKFLAVNPHLSGFITRQSRDDVLEHVKLTEKEKTTFVSRKSAASLSGAMRAALNDAKKSPNPTFRVVLRKGTAHKAGISERRARARKDLETLGVAFREEL